MDEKMRDIALAFAEKSDAEGCLGKTTLGRLLREHGETRKPWRLERMGWFIGVRKTPEGNVGRYRLGEKLVGYVNSAGQEDVAPEDEYAYAQWLVAKKPDLLAQRDSVNLDYEERIKALETERRDKVRAIELRLGEASVAEQALSKLASLKIRRDDSKLHESEPTAERPHESDALDRTCSRVSTD